MTSKQTGYDKRNDLMWCGRYVYGIIGLLFILMDPSGLKEIFTSGNKAVPGLLFLLLALTHHLLYVERQRTREALKAAAEASQKAEDFRPPPAEAGSEARPGDRDVG